MTKTQIKAIEQLRARALAAWNFRIAGNCDDALEGDPSSIAFVLDFLATEAERAEAEARYQAARTRQAEAEIELARYWGAPTRGGGRCTEAETGKE